MAEYSLSANTSYEFPSGDALHLNALVKPTRINLVDVTPYREYALDGTPILTAIDLRGRSDDPKLEWELGGNYERQIGADGNLKVLWVYNHDDTSAEEYRNRVVDDDLFEVSRNLSEVLETEAIVRGSVFWPVSSAQTLETGAEIAENTLDQTIEVFFDLNGDGTAEQADIFAPSSEVTEIRSEIFANHSWSRSQRWSAATSLVYENSKITQRGIDINNSSQFDFIKPRLDIRFSPNASDQLRVRVERTVSQLDFSNFVPRYQIRQDRFSAGNPNLRPETAWEYEVGIERRLADDQGVIEARAFYNDIQDRIESVAIDLDGDGNLDPASGNIGSATEYGAEFLFAIRMTSFGLPNLIVDGRYLTRSSNVTDPFTGQKRSMAVANEYEVELGIRHDMPDRGLSYGMRYVHDGGKLIRSEWQEYRSFSRKPELDAFIELRFASRWTLRVDALGLTQNKRQRDRYVFEDGATIGTLSRSEHFHETRDRRLLLSLTARF
jgi:hypothetical protein